MRDQYSKIIEELVREGLTKTCLMRPEQIFVFAPDKKSVWLTFYKDCWYIGTWGPKVYRIPSPEIILDLCKACVYAASMGAVLSEEITSQFRLLTISDEDAEGIVEWAYADDEDENGDRQN